MSQKFEPPNFALGFALWNFPSRMGGIARKIDQITGWGASHGKSAESQDASISREISRNQRMRALHGKPAESQDGGHCTGNRPNRHELEIGRWQDGVIFSGRSASRRMARFHGKIGRAQHGAISREDRQITGWGRFRDFTSCQFLHIVLHFHFSSFGL